MLGIHVFFVRVQKKALKWTSTIHICIFGSKLFIKASSLCFSGKNVLWNGKPPMCSASVDSNTTYELLECAAVKYLWVYGNWLGFNSRGVGHHQKDGRSTMRAPVMKQKCVWLMRNSKGRHPSDGNPIPSHHSLRWHEMTEARQYDILIEGILQRGEQQRALGKPIGVFATMLQGQHGEIGMTNAVLTSSLLVSH